MACEVASSLVFLHSAPEPIIHMDLKPGEGAWGIAGDILQGFCTGAG